MSITDEIRASCAEIVAQARSVRINLDVVAEVRPATPPSLDPRCHYLEGDPADVADYMLTLDTINFGSGWFPTLRKRELDGKPVSGYFTVSWALADHVRAHGPPSAAWMSAVSAEEIAQILGQDPASELMSLYAQALRSLGRFLAGTPNPTTSSKRPAQASRAAPTHASQAVPTQAPQARPAQASQAVPTQAPQAASTQASQGAPALPARRALDLVAEAGSAECLAEMLARGMTMFDDRGFYKRAQIVANDLALAGVAEFDDLDRLTIFADNLVPHVLRCDGVLVYDEQLAARIDRGEHLTLGGAEREIRACALHACELISKRTGVPARKIDTWLWTRGQSPKYKSRPRHRCRTVFY
jgi:Potential Queuosine, Q, salvage protein family